MDWVHCNSCYVQPEPGLPFCLTNCGHMYCCKCLNISKGKYGLKKLQNVFLIYEHFCRWF